MADKEPVVELTRTELTKALEQWDTDAKSNGWDGRDDKALFADKADYLIHTIRLARGDCRQHAPLHRCGLRQHGDERHPAHIGARVRVRHHLRPR